MIADASEPLQRYDPRIRMRTGRVCGVSGYQSADRDGGPDGGDAGYGMNASAMQAEKGMFNSSLDLLK